MANRKQSKNVAQSPWVFAGFIFIWITATQAYPHLSIFKSLPWLVGDIIFALLVGAAVGLWAYIVNKWLQK